FLSAMGDELGVNGNSYLFAYDPAHQRLTRFSDVLSHTDHASGDFGYGKIHGQIVPGRCGDAYFATYWGTRDGLKYTSTYRGHMLRYTPGVAKLEELRTSLPHSGSLRASTRPAPDGTVYGVTQDPDELFALERDGTIRSLGPARGYSVSLALEPDGSRFYY